MNAHALLGAINHAGMTIRIENGMIHLRRPCNISDEHIRLIDELRARKADVVEILTATCCGQRPVGVAGRPLALSCQLCPTSPTYWRRVPPYAEGNESTNRYVPNAAP